MKDNKYFIIKQTKYNYQHDNYAIHDYNMFDVETAMRKIIALDTLNEDKERISYHLQKVNFSIAETTPLELTEEVKETESKSNQEELPF